MLKSELLEREAEARRTELAATFDELRARVTPGHVLDQLIDYTTESGGGDFLRTLRDQSLANPLALGLVGAGLAWLMLFSGNEPQRPKASSVIRGIRRYLDSRERAGGAISEGRDRVADVAYRASGAVDSIAASARHTTDTASALRDAASSALPRSTRRTATGVRAFASSSAATSRDMIDFCRDHPLVLAGLGVALGAAMGAAFPSTEAERQVSGEASADLKGQTRAFKAEQHEKSKSVTEAVLSEVQNRIKEGSQQFPTASSGIVPSQLEKPQVDKARAEGRESNRPERVGPRDERG
jgi:ElaB/YqjD/DUF883 family membrane-anchored ribosome-binding protein